MKIKRLILSLIILLSGITVNAQEKLIIESNYLTSTDTIFVFIPDNYSKEKSYPLVYLLHGYSTNFTQWSQTINCQDFANKYDMIIVCPDGFTSFYSNSLTSSKSQYESFFFNDLVPQIHNRYNINNRNVFISGLSMGGYGALRYLICYPEYFNTAGSTSGAVVIDDKQSSKLSLLFWGNNRFNDDMRQVFGATVKNWNKNSIVNLLTENKGFNKSFIFDCGTEDILYSENIKLKELTDSLNLPVTFIAQPGNHDTKYWNKSIEYHFVFFKQHLR